MVLGQYSSQRLVATRDSVNLVDYPTRGIAAGCGWATLLVQVYSAGPLDSRTEGGTAGTELQIFIDGFGFEAAILGGQSGSNGSGRSRMFARLAQG